MADPLHDYCKDSIAVWGAWVYFAAGSDGVLKVPCTGGDAVQVDADAGYLAIHKGYLYWERGSRGLWRKDLVKGDLQQLDTAAGYLVVTDDHWVYYQRGNNGALCRVRCFGDSSQVEILDPNGGYMAVDDKNVYFQAGNKGLYRKARDGSGTATNIDPHAGFVLVRDEVVYFNAATATEDYGTYRIPTTGSSGDAKQLDDNGGYMAVPGDGWIYFQGGKEGIHRRRCDGSSPKALPLDENGEYLTIPGDGWIYFQGGPHDNQLYRMVQPVTCPLPAGLTLTVQDQYVVPDLNQTGDKFAVVKALLDEASLDESDRWYINFTSGASSGAHPEDVAGYIIRDLANYLSLPDATAARRLGTIVMDFPDKRPDLIRSLIEYNPRSSPESSYEMTNWMAGVPGKTTLAGMTIPGTHDSCTKDASVFSKCQDLDLQQQLEAGIRFLDIRCRHFQDQFELHHGVEYLDGTFDYVLKSCHDFFARSDTLNEAIIVSIKEEHEPVGNTTTFDQRFMKYVEDNKKSVRWYLGADKSPRLQDVRGQVVLLRRYYLQDSVQCGNRGVDLSAWPENTTFSKP